MASNTAADGPSSTAAAKVSSHTGGGAACAWRMYLVVAVVALLVRGLYLWQLSSAPFFHLMFGDALGYYTWAQRIAAGDWVGSEVFYQAPLYPYVLAGIQTLLGEGVWPIRIVQMVMGVGACVLLAAAGRRMFGPMAGWLAGLGLAVYPTAIYFDGLIQKTSLTMLLVAWLLALLAGTVTRERSVWTWLAIGLAMGLLALVRENAMVFVPLILLWLGAGYADAGWRAKAAWAGAMLLGLVLTVGPVVGRNYALSGEWHVSTSQLGSNFYIGNNPDADGTYTPLAFGRGDAMVERHDARRLAQQATGKTLSPKQVSAYWLDKSVEYIRDQPAHWLRLMGKKVWLLLAAVEVADTEDQYVYAEYASVLRYLGVLWHMGVLLPLAAGGLVLTLGDWRRLGWLYLLIAGYAATLVAFYVFARYRFPLMPMFLLLAAGGVAQLLQGCGRLSRLRLAGAVVLMLVVAVVSNWPGYPVEPMRNVMHYNVAAAFSRQQGSEAQAARFYRKVITADPQYAKAYVGLGVLMARQGDYVQAMDLYSQAIKLQPGYPDAHYNRAVALQRLGDHEAARAAYEQALAADPGYPEAHNALGLMAAQQNDLPAAVAHYQAAIASLPTYAQAHNNLGVALARLGQFREAAAQFAKAVELDPDYADARNNLSKARQKLQAAGQTQ